MSVKGLSASDVRTVKHWYQRDDNAATPCYLLQVCHSLMMCDVTLQLLTSLLTYLITHFSLHLLSCIIVRLVQLDIRAHATKTELS